ncbi:MAG: HupE/UreJ family protein [Candidatus Accumulibacter phosphatis]|uniref:HupE/UreJ family protein n=1 Tax=Candidatus Accumulibacter sp. ACC012 TaxID=2823332 RepID=UPI0025B8E281|nr:HupE/UreJ family protein [Candidatus Accumulibacter sp. ACC012]
MNSGMRMLALLRWALLSAMLSILLASAGAWAHETRPAYLEINATAPGRYDVLWRTPVLSGRPLPIALKFAEGTYNVTEPALRELSDSLLERRVIEAPGGLAGTRIDIVGLQATITDVLVRVQMHDGSHSTTLVHPSQPWLEIAAERGWLSVSGAYLRHGIDHILFGYDHLLFVLALMLIVRQTRMLLWTITAFTVAHSITLALATLGLVHLAGPPLEASIALSILLLASEVVRLQRGEANLTARLPWLVAFSFGLLHGLGFASALASIGLPRGDIPLALVAFNIGVELGQLAFVLVVLACLALARRIKLATSLVRYGRATTPYVIGILASFWFFERLATF